MLRGIAPSEWTKLSKPRLGRTVSISVLTHLAIRKAIASLQRARDSFGAHPDILTYLGFAHRKLNRLDVAESYYRQALAAAPNHRRFASS